MSASEKFEELLKLAKDTFGDTSHSNKHRFIPSGGDCNTIMNGNIVEVRICAAEEDTVSSMANVIWEAAHEAVHVLDVPSRNECTYLEEGLATKFAYDCLAKIDKECANNNLSQLTKIDSRHLKYHNAYTLVSEIDDIESKVKEHRKKNNKNTISSITDKDLSDFGLTDDVKRSKLLAKFYDDDKA